MSKTPVLIVRPSGAWPLYAMSKRSAATSPCPAGTSGSAGRRTTAGTAATSPRASRLAHPLEGTEAQPQCHPRQGRREDHLPATELPLRAREDRDVPQAPPRCHDQQVGGVADPRPPRHGPAADLSAVQAPRPQREAVREATARPPRPDRREVNRTTRLDGPGDAAAARLPTNASSSRPRPRRNRRSSVAHHSGSGNRTHGPRASSRQRTTASSRRPPRSSRTRLPSRSSTR